MEMVRAERIPNVTHFRLRLMDLDCGIVSDMVADVDSSKTTGEIECREDSQKLNKALRLHIKTALALSQAVILHIMRLCGNLLSQSALTEVLKSAESPPYRR